MAEFARHEAERPLAWLNRLAAVDEGELSPAQRRARGACLAEARRLCQEERQREKWRRERA